MKETPEKLARRLEIEAGKTVEFFNSLDPELWLTTVYHANSGWNTKQVLAHFVSAEAAFIELIDNIVHGGDGAPSDLVIDQFNESEVGKLVDASPEELLTSFSENRDRTINLVRNIQESDLERVGRHPFLGPAPLLDIIKLVYRHNQIHIRELRHSGLFD
jgi:hypothetical protein